MRALLALLATAALLLPAGALAQGGAGQQVTGTVEAQFGVAVGADGSFTGSGSTIPVSVSRERVGDTEIVTIVPLK